jgi:glycosyltransferase involved in cell wall biosynthesis
MTKISIVSMNLSTNCTARCLVLAEALAPLYEVDLIGTTFGRDIWPPIKGMNGTLPIKAVPGDLLPGYLPQIRKLLSLIDGDVIIACKLRFPSFGIALIKRAISGTPVILDIDDDEVAQTALGLQAPLTHQLRHTNGALFTRLIQPAHRLADGVFSVSEPFRKHYGGVIVPHGRDAEIWDPARFDRAAIRRRFGFAEDDIVIGFLGTLQRSKGTDLLASAAARTNNPRIRVMIAGMAADGDDYIDELRRRFGDRILLLPPFPAAMAPEYQVAVDVIVLPQRNVAESFGQMPAKLTEAMAMGKTIIASAISDIPKYLEGCGLLVPPDDEEAITEKLNWIAANREAAVHLGQKARERFLRDMTYATARDVMVPEIERIVARRKRRSGKHAPSKLV